jgi:hypothetical protein
MPARMPVPSILGRGDVPSQADLASKFGMDNLPEDEFM